MRTFYKTHNLISPHCYSQGAAKLATGCATPQLHAHAAGLPYRHCIRKYSKKFFGEGSSRQLLVWIKLYTSDYQEYISIEGYGGLILALYILIRYNYLTSSL